MRSRHPTNATVYRVHLDAYRLERGYTIRQTLTLIAEEYLREHGRRYRARADRPPGISVRSWDAWRAGHMPRPELQGPITRVLRASRANLWELPGEYREPDSTDPSADPTDPSEESMDRRRVLSVAGTVAAATLTAATTAGVAHPFEQQLAVRFGGPVVPDLDAIERDIRELTRGGHPVPAATLLPLLELRLAALAGWRDQRVAGPAREVQRVLGMAALGHAWLAYSSRRLAQAEHSFGLAGDAALAAGDWPLAAAVAARHSALTLTGGLASGGPARALAQLGYAQELVRGGRSIVAARVHSMTASLHCRLGREQPARASLRLLEYARGHALDEGDRRGLYGYGPRQQLMVEATYQLAFGSPERALDLAGRAAEASPPREVIDRNIIRILSATAQLRLGDHDAAAVIADPVLAVPPVAWHGSLGDRLTRFVAELSGSRAPRARQFCADYRQLRRAHHR